jgi:hypothetical protein
MESPERRTLNWMDLLWLVFLAALAIQPPRDEVHKQLIILAIGGNSSRGRIVSRNRAAGAPRGPTQAGWLPAAQPYRQQGINSNYYPILFCRGHCGRRPRPGALFWCCWSRQRTALPLSVLLDYELAGGVATGPLNLFSSSPPSSSIASRLKIAELRYRFWPNSLPNNRLLEHARAGAPFRTPGRAGPAFPRSGARNRNPLSIIGSTRCSISARSPNRSAPSGADTSPARSISGDRRALPRFARPLPLELQPTSLAALIDRALPP